VPGLRKLVLPFALVAVATYAFGLTRDLFWVRMLSKPWPILALIAWVRWRRDDQDVYSSWVERGLWLCLLGDLLLEERDRLFLPGVIAFLAGHVCYVVAYVRAEGRLRLLIGLPFAAWGLGLFLYLLPGLGPMTVPLGVYAAVLSAMMWRASARLDAHASWPVWFAAAGALAFGISDSLIALDRYGEPILHVRYAIISLYWLGQTGIAASAALSTGGRGIPTSSTTLEGGSPT
jgi:alkenylglycerophosphocholine/alkenylglycerophosphoethanolamine hydrolase